MPGRRRASGDDEDVGHTWLARLHHVDRSPQADINSYIALLKRDATISALGAMEPLVPFSNISVNYHRRNIPGSLIGSIAETQEVLDFCAEHGILPDIETIQIQDVNAAQEKLKSSDVRFRYVIDCTSLRQSEG